jgi:hypothetical protein
MAINYVKLAATAKRLIEGNGRSLTLTKRSEVLTDNQKPWRGTAPGALNVNETALTVIGLFTGFESVVDTITKEKRSMQVVLIAAKSAVTTGGADIDLTPFDLVIDGDRRYEVNDTKLVYPGTTRLLWKMSLKQ